MTSKNSFFVASVWAARIVLSVLVIAVVITFPGPSGQALFDDTAAVRSTEAIDPGDDITIAVNDAEWTYDAVTGAGKTVLIVDDDEVADSWPSTARSESMRLFIQALNAAGFSLDFSDDCTVGSPVYWDTATGACGGAPSGATLSGYDLVIWYTGNATDTAAAGGELLDPASGVVADLDTFVGGGGDLLLVSHEYLDSVDSHAGACTGVAPYTHDIATCTSAPHTSFIETYLGVDEYSRFNRSTTGGATPPALRDTQPVVYDGIATDPIGDSVSIGIRSQGAYREATLNTLTLFGSAFPILEENNDTRYGGSLAAGKDVAMARTSAAGPIGSGRVVFSPVLFENQYNRAAEDNFRTLFERTISYLADSTTVTVTNPRTSEVETVTLNNSGLGVLVGSVSTSSGTVADPSVGVIAVLPGDQLTTSYTDVSPGTTTIDQTSVVTTATLTFRDGSFNALTEIPVPGSFYAEVNDLDQSVTAGTDSFSVTITSSSGDSETFIATETTVSSGIFRTSLIPTVTSDTGSGDGQLRVADGGTVSLSYDDLGAEVIKTFVQESWHTSPDSDSVTTVDTSGWTEKDSHTDVDTDEQEYFVNSDTVMLGNEWLRNEFAPTSGPLLEGYTTSPGATFFDESGAGSPTVIQDPTSGDYLLYYTGTNSAFVSNIGLATSAVGTSPIGRDFVKYPTNTTYLPLITLITPAVGTDFDYECGASDPTVVYDPTAAGGPFVMFFAGSGTSGSGCGGAQTEHNIGRAVSADGISWTVDTLPSITVGTGGLWDDLEVTQPSVLVDPAAGPTKYKMWFAGQNSPVGGDRAIGLATSPTGLPGTWTKVDGVPATPAVIDPVLSPVVGEIDSFSVENPTVVIDPSLGASGEFVMYYEFSTLLVCPDDGTLSVGIARAESADSLSGVAWTRGVKASPPVEQAATCDSGGSTTWENIVFRPDGTSGYEFGVSEPMLMVDPLDGIDRLYYSVGTEVGAVIAIAWNLSANAAGSLYSNPIDLESTGLITTGVGAFKAIKTGHDTTTISARTSDTLADLLFDPTPGVSYPASPPSPNLTQGALLGDFPLVTNGEKYLQYEVEVAQDTSPPGATFSGPSFVFTDALETIDPDVFQQLVTTLSLDLLAVEAATDATVRISDVTFLLDPDNQSVTYDLNDALNDSTKTVVDENGAEILPGDELDYTINVTNSSSSSLTDVTVYDQVPLGTTYVAGSIFGVGANDGNQPALTWNIGTLGPGETQVIGFSVTVDPDIGFGSELLNQAFINSVETGVIPTDDPRTPVKRDSTIVAVGASILLVLLAAAGLAGIVTWQRNRKGGRNRAIVAGLALSALLIPLVPLQAAIGTGNEMYFEVADADQNTDDAVVNTVNASVSTSGGDLESITLTETDPTTNQQSTDSGVFRGSMRAVLDNVQNTGNQLIEVEPFQTITLSYDDLFNTSGSTVTRTDSADVAVSNLYRISVVARQPTALPSGGISAPIDASPRDVFGIPAPDGTSTTFSSNVGSVTPNSSSVANGVASTVFTSSTIINPSTIAASVATAGITDTGTVALTTTTSTSTTTTTSPSTIGTPPDIDVTGGPTGPPGSGPGISTPGGTVQSDPPGGVAPDADSAGGTGAIKNFLDSELVQNIADITSTVIAPIIGALALLNLLLATSIGSWYPILLRIFLEPLQIFYGRRRFAWGTVYNSLTKQAVDLAIVRLYRISDGKLIGTKVTDRAGRFGFLVDKPAGYRLTVSKEGLTFPSTLLRGLKTDGAFGNVYTGGRLDIARPNFVDANVPVDPAEDLINIKNAIRRNTRRAAHVVIAYGGIFIGALAFLVARTNLSLLLLALHAIIFLLFWRLAKGRPVRPWGTVYERLTKKPLARAVIQIFDTKYNKLLETRVADRLGRYGFLVGGNTYKVRSVKPGYRFPAAKSTGTRDYMGGEFTTDRPSAVAFDLPMDRVRPGEPEPPHRSANGVPHVGY